MHMRSAAAAAILLVALGTVGCSKTPVQGRTGATLTIDGKEQGRNLALQCNQLQTSWFLNISAGQDEATAIVDVNGAKSSVETVSIRGFDDFAGSFWQGGDGAADATVLNGIFTINGKAAGLGTADHRPRTAAFKIVARC